MTNKTNAKASAPLSERQRMAAQVLLILTDCIDANGAQVAVPLDGQSENQKQAAAKLMQSFDLQIGALEALMNGKILDADQRRDIRRLREGLNELYIFLASAMTGGSHD